MNHATQAIYRDMEYAKSLIRRKTASAQAAVAEAAASTLTPGDKEFAGINVGIGAIGAGTAPGAEEDEEAWTFIGDESDPELKRGIVERDAHARQHQRGSLGASGTGDLGVPDSSGESEAKSSE